MNTVLSNNFLPTITKPTRVTEGSFSLIDNILTNIRQTGSFTSGILVTDLSDHFPIFLRTSPGKRIYDKGYFTRNYSCKNINCFTSFIQDSDWDPVYLAKDVNIAYDKFTSVFQNMYDECFPLVFISNSERRKKRYP